MATPSVSALAKSPTTNSHHDVKSCRIETFRFVLTDEEEWELSQQLEHLAIAMPEEASVKLSFTMDEDYYFRGTLSVQTMSRFYQSTEEGLDPMEIFGLLEEDILNKVSRWGYRNHYTRRVS
tara:strand:+ start:12521 stop:12886 length:366 start_codon:yes stop_codon:yes gene_type:complete